MDPRGAPIRCASEGVAKVAAVAQLAASGKGEVLDPQGTALRWTSQGLANVAAIAQLPSAGDGRCLV